MNKLMKFAMYFSDFITVKKSHLKFNCNRFKTGFLDPSVKSKSGSEGFFQTRSESDQKIRIQNIAFKHKKKKPNFYL